MNTLLIVLSLGTFSLQAAVQHTIKSGDTLWDIAKKYDISITKVRQENGIQKGEVLKLGKTLTIPTQKSYQKYSIKSGDTLSAIAYKYHTSVTKIREANKMKKGETLKLGRVLKVPGKQYSVKKKAIMHTIKSGDTLSALAPKYGISVSDIRKLNGMKKGETLKLGRVLHVSPTTNYRDVKKKRGDIFEIVAKKKLGKRYVWGASGRNNTYDCSSFTKYVYRKNGITIPRTSIKQSKHGEYIKRKDLKKGDLVFFDTSKQRKGYVNHVGIYLGNNKFIHASSAKKKVIVSNLSKFYGQRYKGARRPL